MTLLKQNRTKELTHKKESIKRPKTVIQPYMGLTKIMKDNDQALKIIQNR